MRHQLVVSVLSRAEPCTKCLPLCYVLFWHHCWSQGDDDESRDYSNCRPLHTQPNALLAAAAASADADAAEAPLGSDWRKQHVLYGNDNHYMFFRCAAAVLAQQPGCCCWHSVLVMCCRPQAGRCTCRLTHV